jgi:hypothetical protein
MSMGVLLDHIADRAEEAGRRARHASNLFMQANDLDWRGEPDAAERTRQEAREAEAEYARLKNSVAELRKQALDQYMQFTCPADVRVVDLRSGDHGRQEYKEAAE